MASLIFLSISSSFNSYSYICLPIESFLLGFGAWDEIEGILGLCLPYYYYSREEMLLSFCLLLSEGGLVIFALGWCASYFFDRSQLVLWDPNW